MNNVGMDFNFANTEDIENIIRIMRYGYHECWDKKFFLNLIKNKNSILYILKKKKCVVGFIAGMISEIDCDIIMMVIDIKSRQKGFGSLLLNNTLYALKGMGINNIYLEVSVNNIPAIDLYERSGFKKISTRKSYYKYNGTMIDAALYQMVNSEN
jgi:ribosomal-protein-alanine N-acetyltransferase